MIEEDARTRETLDALHPFGTIRSVTGTTSAWTVRLTDEGKGDGGVPTLILVATDPRGRPFRAEGRFTGSAAPTTLAADLASRTLSSSNNRQDWVRELDLWRESENVAKFILNDGLPNHLPSMLRLLAFDVERHCPWIKGMAGKLTQAAHATLRRVAAFDEHLTSVLPPKLAAFIAGKEGRLAFHQDWMAEFQGSMLDACIAYPHAWEPMSAYKRVRASRVADLLASGDHGTLAMEAMTHAGVPAELAERAKDADAACLASADMPWDAFLDNLQLNLVSKGRAHVTWRDLVDMAPFAQAVPADPEGWRTALAMGPSLRRLRTVKQAIHDPDALRRIADPANDWTGFRDRMLSASDKVSMTGLMEAFSDVERMASAFMDQILDPALAMQEGLAPNATTDDLSKLVKRRVRLAFSSSLLQSGRDVIGQLANAKAWHAGLEGYEDKVRFGTQGTATPVSTWGKGFPDAMYADMVIHVLSTPIEIRIETGVAPDTDGVPGLGVEAGTLPGRCLIEDVRFASVRQVSPDGHFRKVALVELGYDPARGFTSSKVVAFAKDAPRGRVTEAVTAYGKDLVRRVLSVNHADFRGRDRRPTTSEVAGYRWHEAGAWNEAAAHWVPFTATPLMGATPQGLVAALKVAALRGETRWWCPETPRISLGERVDVSAALAVLDSTPDVPPDAGDEMLDEDTSFTR